MLTHPAVHRAVVTVSATLFAIAAGASLPAAAAVRSSNPSDLQAVPGVAPAGLADTATYLNISGQVLPGPEAKPLPTRRPSGLPKNPMAGCTPESGRDNPHYSSGDVSGHGWWRKGSCTASAAHVYNCLYEWYTDNTWRQKACSPKKQLKPYTGSGQRTVARARCNTTALTSWRNHVDVDVDGQIDSAEKPMNQADVACRVP